MNMKEKAPIT